MVKYTPQREWIEGKGIFLWLAFYTGGLGGGLYLASLFTNNISGMVVSWFIVAVLKGGFHLLYLGKPLRFWRIILKPQTSWISRGFIFVAGFIVFAAVQIVVSYMHPGSVAEIPLKAVAGAMAFGEAIYTGFAMNYVNGLPFWNSALVPVLFIVYGLLGGLAVLMAIVVIAGSGDLAVIEEWARTFMISGAVLLAIYLWSARYMGETARHSVCELLTGAVSSIFWIGLVVLGIVIPLAVSTVGYFVGGVSLPALMGAVVCEIIGGLSLRYCLLRGGYYAPLIPTDSPR